MLWSGFVFESATKQGGRLIRSSKGEKMQIYWFVIGILCVWRVTHLLQAEDGPWNIVVFLRRTAGMGFYGKLLDCFYCLSIWVSAPLAFYLGGNLKEQLLLWPSLSAGAIFCERITASRHEIEPAAFLEDKEKNHVMLREPKGKISDDSSTPQRP